jgi:hypothetical protein
MLIVGPLQRAFCDLNPDPELLVEAVGPFVGLGHQW